ncbi:MAG: MBL fold metallo-hydrolase [Tepidiformaceae bacterium]
MNTVQVIRLSDNSIYLIGRNNEYLLVDTGPNYKGAWAHIKSEIKSLTPNLVFITHGHHDHASLGSVWQNDAVPVWVGTADQKLVSEPIFSNPEEFSATMKWLDNAGVPEPLITIQGELLQSRKTQALRAASGIQDSTPSGRWPSTLSFSPFLPDKTVSEQTSLESAVLIPCPGHTVGNFVVAVPEEGWLFSGDQLLPEFDPTPSIQFITNETGKYVRFRSLPAYVKSLEKLLPYNFTYCFPGHGSPFEDPNTRIKSALARIERRVTRIEKAIIKGIEPTAYALAQHLYPHAINTALWQLIATTQGCLDILENKNK